MYTLTFGTPTVDTSSAALPFTINQALGGYPYTGNISATGGGETKTGIVTVDANSTTGEIVFTGLSAGTAYAIAQGNIEVAYMGEDKYLAHEGVSFTTASYKPKVATEDQWQDLATRVKSIQPPLVISLSAPVTTAQNLTADAASALEEAYTSGRPVMIDARAQRVTPSEAIDDFAKGIFLVTKINRAGALAYQLSLDTIAETSFNRYERRSYFISVSSSSPYGWSCFEVNSDSYRTVETNTGATWIDGSAIYKKTIDFGALPNAASKTVNLNISNLGTIVNSEAFCVYPNGVNFPLPFTNTNDFASSVMLSFTSTQAVITTASDRSGGNGFITLYYTKSS